MKADTPHAGVDDQLHRAHPADYLSGGRCLRSLGGVLLAERAPFGQPSGCLRRKGGLAGLAIPAGFCPRVCLLCDNQLLQPLSNQGGDLLAACRRQLAGLPVQVIRDVHGRFHGGQPTRLGSARQGWFTRERKRTGLTINQGRMKNETKTPGATLAARSRSG